MSMALISPMCSGGVTVTIIGANVDAAVEPILTLFSGSNSKDLE